MKYYELTIELTEQGWEKKINESDIIKIENGNIERDCGAFVVNHKYIVDMFCVLSTNSKAKISTIDEFKLDIYYEQAKELIIKQLRQERDRINKLLEANQ